MAIFNSYVKLPEGNPWILSYVSGVFLFFFTVHNLGIDHTWLLQNWMVYDGLWLEIAIQKLF